MNTMMHTTTPTPLVQPVSDIQTLTTIKAQADVVLAKNQVRSPIVNVFDIAAAEGIAIAYRNFQPQDRSVSGFYFQKDRTIYLNVEEPSTRQVFTIAHELGHYYLGHKADEYGVYRRQSSLIPNSASGSHLTGGRQDNGVKHTNEVEADHFAANLLMPEAMVRAELAKYPFLKTAGVSLLALRFGVSADAMGKRLRHLGVFKK